VEYASRRRYQPRILADHRLLQLLPEAARGLDSNSAGPQNWENWQNHTMLDPRTFSRLLMTLVVAGVLTPITLSVIVGVAALLSQMGDTCGGSVLYRVALAGGIFWVVDLICLLLLVAIGSLSASRESDETPE
jgi:hypothetical protein